MPAPVLLRVAAALSLPLFCAPVLAGRPLVTDDAAVTAPGTCQVEASLQRDPSQGWVIPACNVAQGWEVGAGAGWIRTEGRTQRALAVHAKTVFRPLTEDSWGAGLTLAQQQPTAHDSARDRTATLLFSAPVAPWATVHANLGGVHHRATRSAALTWAAALETSAGRTGLTLEAFGERRAYRTWQAGWRWSAIQDVLDLDVAYGIQKGDGVRTPYAGLGMTWVFPR